MADTKIYFKKKDYDLQYQKQKRQFEICQEHPLHKDWGATKKKSNKNPMNLYKSTIPVNSSNNSNPLAKNPMNPLNPLARIPKQSDIKQSNTNLTKTQIQKIEINGQNEEKDNQRDGQTPWMFIRQEFVKAYDIKKQNLSLLVDNPFGNFQAKTRTIVQKSSSMSYKQIDIKTYLSILQDYKKDLRARWQEDDRVKTLQLTIQATKLLHDSQKAKFHALKFAYVIQIVESFGVFVFKRIKSLSFPGLSAEKVQQIGMHQLPSHNIPDSAQTICRNWLLKIGAIRQLIPRSIIETTLLRLYFFIDNGKRVKHILYRLAKTNRCYGQYINSIFFSTFLIRIGIQVLPKQKECVLLYQAGKQLFNKVEAKFVHPQLDQKEFYNVIKPFFKIAFEGLGQNLDQQDFKRLTKALPPNPHSSIMRNLISSFNLELLGTYCVDLMKMIQRVPKEQRYSLYATFLKKLSNTQFETGKQLTAQLWEYFGDIEDTNVFLEILAPFVQIIFLNFKGSHRLFYINKILDKFNTLIVNQQAHQGQFFVKFQDFLVSMLVNPHLFETFTIEPFLQTITYFPKSIKQKISHKISVVFMQREEKTISDPMIVNTMLTLIKNLQKNKETTRIIMGLIKKVDFGNDFEGQLNFYADVRAVFSYMSQVTIYLINKAILLAIKVRRFSRGKIRPFLQACITYCYVTIPLIESHKIRTQLYLYTSQVALSFNLVSQSNDLLKSSIKSLTECKDQSLQNLFYLFQKMINFLIVTPDDPQGDYLFLFNGMFNAFDQIQSKDETKLRMYTDFIVYLSAQVQDKLPTHIEGVVSNDELFKMKQFRQTIIQKLQQIFTKLEMTLEILKNPGQQDKKFKAILNSTLTLSHVLQYSERLEAHFNNVSKVLSTLSNKAKDPKIVLPFKSLAKSVSQKLLEQEYEIKWVILNWF